MAKEDKKSWIDRAWGWRDNLRKKAKPVFDRMERKDREWAEKIQDQIPVASDSVKDFWKHRDERKNWKDTARIFGNYLDWEKDLIGASARTIPRGAGFDIEFYNPFDIKEGARRHGKSWNFIPGMDFQWDRDLSRSGVGATQYLDTTLGNIMGGQYDETLSLANPKSVASKFLNQYDSQEAYRAWINDNITDKDRENIKGAVDKELNWFDWANEHPYNPREDFYDAKNNLAFAKEWEHFLDPYMKDVGEKYQKRMLDEFGAYDTQNPAYMSNLGSEKPMIMQSMSGDEQFAMDTDWFNAMMDDDPDNDRSYPEEFNFGAFDPLYDAWTQDFKYEYDEPEHYEHILPNLAAGILTAGGAVKTMNTLARRAPNWMQAGLKVAHPGTTQLGPWPTTRGLAQTGIIPVLSETWKQDYYYPSE